MLPVVIGLTFRPMVMPWNTVQWDVLDSVAAQSHKTLVSGVLWPPERLTAPMLPRFDAVTTLMDLVPSLFSIARAWNLGYKAALTKPIATPFWFVSGHADTFLAPNFTEVCQAHLRPGTYGVLPRTAIAPYYWMQWDYAIAAPSTLAPLFVLHSDDVHFSEEFGINGGYGGWDHALQVTLNDKGRTPVDLSPWTKAWHYHHGNEHRRVGDLGYQTRVALAKSVEDNHADRT